MGKDANYGRGTGEAYDKAGDAAKTGGILAGLAAFAGLAKLVYDANQSANQANKTAQILKYKQEIEKCDQQIAEARGILGLGDLWYGDEIKALERKKAELQRDLEKLEET